MTWEDVIADKAKFIGGQTQFSYLGDTYRGVVEDIDIADPACAYIRMDHVAIWCDRKWHLAEPILLEALRGGVLAKEADGAFRFNILIGKFAALYPKGHRTEISFENLSPLPLIA